MIQPVPPIPKYTDYDLDNGQVYDVKTGKNVDISLKSFAEILEKEVEKHEKLSNM